MTLTELANLVAEMRSAQKDYFRTKTPSGMVKAKSLEAKVDRAIGEVLKQPSLFGEQDNE